MPLLSAGGGLLAGGAVVSEGGMVAELVESAGAAGAVVDESEGALGEVDCCLEHATMARALRHNKRILRFMFHLTDWGRAIQASRRPVDPNTASQAAFHGPPRRRGRRCPASCSPRRSTAGMLRPLNRLSGVQA